MADIDKMWRMVEFGRAPDPDYSISLADRRGLNIEKAENLLKDMKKAKIRPDIVTLTTLMGVYSEALRVEGTTHPLIDRLVVPHTLALIDLLFVCLID